MSGGASLDRLEARPRGGDPFVVIEAIKLVEGGLAEQCDEVWLVECRRRAARPAARSRGMAADEIERRLAAQGADLAERLSSRATRRISTSGSLAEMHERVEDALADALAPVMLRD